MCNYHVKANIEKYLKPLSKSGTSKELKEDMRALQVSLTKESFAAALKPVSYTHLTLPTIYSV